VDWVSAVSTAVGAVATLAAVLVALFWRDVQAGRRRPKLAIRVDGASYQLSTREPGILETPLIVTNAPDKDVAENVEILISVGIVEDESGGGPLIIDAEPLTWQSGLLGHYGQPAGVVPPGTTRRAYFAYLGARRQIFSRHFHHPASSAVAPEDARIVGAFATYPARSDLIHWIEPGTPYSVRLDVTVGSAGTHSLSGHFILVRETEDEQFLDDPDQLFSFTWRKPLQLIAPRHGQTGSRSIVPRHFRRR